MLKEHLEFFPLDLSTGWEVPKGYPSGLKQKILSGYLDEERRRGTRTRLLRFDHARELAGTMPWTEVAFECGYYDQSHLINDFRAVTGRSPETFLQDAERAAA